MNILIRTCTRNRQLTLFEPRYNIAPTQEILAIRADPRDGRRSVAMLRWGLIPSWTKAVSGPPLINARGESLAEKPAFRSRRCPIPADGFYEWQQPPGGRGKKQPFYIHCPERTPFALGGFSR